MRKITAKAGIAVMLLVSLASTSISAAPQPNDINLIVNFLPVDSGVKPIVKNGRTLAPIRVISESLGSNINWDKVTKQITIKKGSDLIEMTVSKPQVKLNGKTQVLEQPPILHNNSTMLPLRFIGEALNCDVQWDAKTRTVTVTDKNMGVEKPNFTTDRWGRKIRTTNLPKNAAIFPYIVEGVPNWVYEQINMTHRALIESAGVSSKPKQLYNNEKEGDSMEYDKMVSMLNTHFENVLNIDYRTIDDGKFLETILDTYDNNDYPSFATSLEDGVKQYIKYVKDNKIITKGEFQVLPEMFWENTLDTDIVSAYVKLTVIQQGPKGGGGFQSFGTVTGNGKTPFLKSDLTYEGLIQTRISSYKVDYDTAGITSQISLDNNVYGGAKKTDNPYKAQ